MSSVLMIECDRIGCGAEEVIDVDGPYDAQRTVLDLLPAGWGWDRVGLDAALHCPEHRVQP